MLVNIAGLKVYFPYDYIYPEQYAYMLELKRALDARGHAVLEMPSGTGKTVCLLSLVCSYQWANPAVGKLVYCTRTVPEMAKCLLEMHKVLDYYLAETGQTRDAIKFTALGLTSRKNLCLHERVSSERDGKVVDAGCRNLTATWVRERHKTDASVDVCDYFEAFDKTGRDAMLPAGVYTLDDLREYGAKNKWCPYFLSRLVWRCDVTIR